MLSAEFPNDNPALHEGTIWVCLEVTGAPVAERRLEPTPVVVAAVVSEPIAVEPPAIEPIVVEPVIESMVHPVIETLAEPILPSTVEPVVDVESPAPPPARESGIFMTFSSLQNDEDDLDEEGEILVEELGPLEDAVIEQVVSEAVVEAATEIVPEVIPEPVSTIAPPPPDDAYVTLVSTLVEIAIAHGAAAAAGELPATLAADETAQGWAGILRGTSEDWDAVGGSMLDEWAAATLSRITGADANVLKRDLRARGIAAFGLAA